MDLDTAKNGSKAIRVTDNEHDKYHIEFEFRLKSKIN